MGQALNGSQMGQALIPVTRAGVEAAFVDACEQKKALKHAVGCVMPYGPAIVEHCMLAAGLESSSRTVDHSMLHPAQVHIGLVKKTIEILLC